MIMADDGLSLSGEQYQAPKLNIPSPLAGEQYAKPKISVDSEYYKTPKASGSVDLGGGFSASGHYQDRGANVPPDVSAKIKFTKGF
jgi:hypothetical protein